MDSTKGNRRRSATIELKSELLNVLEDQYDKSRSMHVTFTAFVNGYLEDYVKKQRMLKKIYPTFNVILSDPDKGFYIKDRDKDEVAEIKANTEDTNGLLRCSIDKEGPLCKHIEFALLSFDLMNMFETSLSESGRDTSKTGKEHGARIKSAVRDDTTKENGFLTV